LLWRLWHSTDLLSGRTVGLFGLTNSTINNLIGTAGYPIVALLVAIESSGIPFPGETTLVLAAVYAGAPGNHLSIAGVIVAAAMGAIVGDNVGFTVGRVGGRRVIDRYGHHVHLQPHHLAQAEVFFAKHGNKTVFLGRFVAVLRAWAAFLAGVNRMPWPTFLAYNAAGGIIWAIAYGLLGYFLGNNLPLLFHVIRIIGITGVVLTVLVIAGAGVVIWRRRHNSANGGPEPPSSTG
jgi:membrane protein DedA with SNARE-associated domain